MACVTIIVPTTDAVSTAREANANSYASVTFFAGDPTVPASVLAGAEEVDIFIYGVATVDASATVKKLTATQPMLTFEGGIRYEIKKDATVAAVGVYMLTNNR